VSSERLGRSIVAAVLATALFFAICTVAVGAPILKPGDKMVFLGDSITEQRIYTRFVMDYFALRYPGANITFRNAGWGGDTSPGGLNRLQRDVLSLKPTIVSICFGMNDAGYGPFKQDVYDRYMTGMQGLVTELKKAGVKVVLLTPGCVDSDNNSDLNGYNDTLSRFAKGIVDLATKENLPVYNIHTLMFDAQTKAKKDDPNFTMIPDSVHPNDRGHILMAYGLLKALGCTEHASGLTIDIAKSAAITDRCKIKDLKITPDSIIFTRTDEALPIYFSQDAQAMFKYCPLVDELNQYRFKVTGLSGNWKLTVQGIDVGTFTSDELTSGINLSTYAGPWQKLGEDIDDLARNQEQMYFVRWREISPAAWLSDDAKAKLQPVGKEFDKVIADWETERLKKAAQNRTWEWKLVRV
jgi:lysophospholipase L1-like esterase